MENLHAEQVENKKLKKQEYNKRQYGKNKDRKKTILSREKNRNAETISRK